MSRGKVITLVALAVAVLLFDAWFFFGNGATAAPIQEMDEEIAAEVGTDEGPSPGSSAPALAGDVPWHAPSLWPLPARRPPRRGRPRPGLMVRRLPDPGDAAAGAAALPDRVPVILWRPEGALALLDGRLVREGDRVGPWVVREIRPDRVGLVRAGRPGDVRELPLGKPARPRPATAADRQAAAESPAETPTPDSPPAPPAREEVP